MAQRMFTTSIQHKYNILNWQIPVVADLPVGENLQDQVIGDGITFYSPYAGVSVTTTKSDFLASAWAYSIFGTGFHTLSWLLHFIFSDGLKTDSVDCGPLASCSYVAKQLNRWCSSKYKCSVNWWGLNHCVELPASVCTHVFSIKTDAKEMYIKIHVKQVITSNINN